MRNIAARRRRSSSARIHRPLRTSVRFCTVSLPRGAQITHQVTDDEHGDVERKNAPTFVNR